MSPPIPDRYHMYRTLSCFLIIITGFVGLLQAQTEQSLEEVIASTIPNYPFTASNAFRLSAYAELKGRYEQTPFSLTLPFGTLGSLTFYRKSCLLRTEAGRVYTLDPARDGVAQATYLNNALGDIMEHIMLLGDRGVDPAKRAFVDQHLARKHIEPFAKLYLRHVMLHYGRFDETNGRLTLHTDWLPEEAIVMRGESDGGTVKRPKDPLMVNLDADILRGYYLKSGGTVYVEDVDRVVAYASGEEYAYNVAAFKLFAQKIFSRTTQYITTQEKARLVALSDQENFPFESSITPAPSVVDLGKERAPTPAVGVSRGGSSRPVSQRPNVRDLRPRAMLPPGYRPRKRRIVTGPQLYGPETWITMMLTILRKNGVNIGDPEILPYFIDQPYFEAIYKRLTEEERQAVERFQEK